MTLVILFAMKTAISVPDELFEAADRLARRLGSSRSELYATAVAEFLERHKFQGVRERLDAVYSDNPEESELDPVLSALQQKALPREDW
jgi:metal-responsive CopG/Arc/MetJ family transcriptional regulator